MPSVPEDTKDKKIIMIEIAVTIFVLTGVFALWYFRNDSAQVKLDTSSSSASRPGGTLQLSGNRVSDSNPFQTDTNPLSEIYENPFE